MSSLKLGEHTTTFRGNPLVCAAACAAIDVLIEEKLAETGGDVGSVFQGKVSGPPSKHKVVREVRGLGLMLGMELAIRRFEYNS